MFFDSLWYKIFNYGTIVIVAIFALLIFTKSVGVEHYKTFLYLTILIFVIRIIVRSVLIYKNKKRE